VVLCIVLVMLSAPPSMSESTEAPQRYDPWEGMDPDGRIPAVDKQGLAHPERWRYIPEGRIKPGNLFQRFLVSSFIVPLFFRDSDVGIGGGVAITDIDFREQRRREFMGTFLTYTSEGQQNYTLVWRRWMHHIDRPEGGVLQEERSFWRASAGYSKTLTRRFFGLGSNTNEDDESSYTDQVWRAEFGFEASLPDPSSNWVGGAGLRAELHELGDGRKSGADDTSMAFTNLFDDAEHTDLGWFDVELRYDTRDSQRNPYRGWYVGGHIDAALIQTHAEVGAIFTLEGSKIFPVPGLFHRGGGERRSAEENPPTDVLALGFRVQQATGDLPFFALPELGGSNTLRGYIAGRFRGDSSWTASAEYRFWVLTRGIPIYGPIRIERIGLAAFYEAGAVAGHAKALTRAEVRNVVGFGFRMLLERAAPFRVDVGFSDESIEVTARFGLSF
jgi:hypothetical protein